MQGIGEVKGVGGGLRWWAAVGKGQGSVPLDAERPEGRRSRIEERKQ